MRTTLTLLVMCALLAPLACGCRAQRTLNIDSDPAGALVFINGQEAGRTPFRHDFEFYGNYDVVLRKEGYETLKTTRRVKAPISAYPPFDLVSEMVGTRDVRDWRFELSPARPGPVDPELLINRAQALESDLRSSRYTRPPSTMPATATGQ
jgi:hypothetical protein